AAIVGALAAPFGMDIAVPTQLRQPLGMLRRIAAEQRPAAFPDQLLLSLIEDPASSGIGSNHPASTTKQKNAIEALVEKAAVLALALTQLPAGLAKIRNVGGNRRHHCLSTGCPAGPVEAYRADRSVSALHLRLTAASLFCRLDRPHQSVTQLPGIGAGSCVAPQGTADQPLPLTKDGLISGVHEQHGTIRRQLHQPVRQRINQFLQPLLLMRQHTIDAKGA